MVTQQEQRKVDKLGANIHIFVFTELENNGKAKYEYMNISPPPHSIG